MLALSPRDPNCPLGGRKRETFCDGLVDERRILAAPDVLFKSSANGVV